MGIDLELPTNRIQMFRGDTKPIVVNAKHPDETPWDLTTAVQCVLTCKTRAGDTTILFQKDGTFTSRPNGQMRFVIVPSDTATLKPGQYPYDIQCVFADGSVRTFSKEFIDIGEDVTTDIVVPAISGLVARWTMEDAADIRVVKDYSPNGYDLDVVGVAPALIEGRVGSFARQFFASFADGSLISSAAAAAVDAARLLFKNSSYTVALWVNPTTLNPVQPAFESFQLLLGMYPPNSNNGLFYMFLRDMTPPLSQGQFQFQVGWGGGFTNVGSWLLSNIPADAWTHLAVTFNRISDMDGTFRLYQNGVLAYEETGWAPPDQDQANCQWQMAGITVDPGLGDKNPLTGGLDEVRVYNRVLTDAEIAALAA